MSTIILQAAPAGGGSSFMLIMLVMIVGFYFLMLRPQVKKQKQQKQFQDSIKPGTKVVMTSGLHGKIVQVLEDGVIIETMAGKQKFEKAAISREYTEARFGDKKNQKPAGLFGGLFGGGAAAAKHEETKEPASNKDEKK